MGGSTSDNLFGPHLPGTFDFTLLFEQSILALLPAGLFAILAPWRILRLWRRSTCVRFDAWLWCKLATISVLICLQIALVALWSLPTAPRTRTSTAEAVIGLCEVVLFAPLSYMEHRKSSKPSALLNGYLCLTTILYLALARSYWTRSTGLRAVASIFTVSLGGRALLLVFEEMPKRLIESEKGARETSAGVVSRSVFWWLNALFFKGFRFIIDVDDLGTINEKMDSERLLSQLEAAWAASPKTGKYSLMRVTFWTYRWQFVAGMLPRLLYTGFKFAQPFLINTVIDFVGQPKDEQSSNVAGGLIGATVLVYVGLALTRAWYMHMTFQLLTMYRGALASMVFHKTLKLETSAIKDSAPVTLMSTDIEGIVEAGHTMHDLWAAYIELPIGIYLLYRQVGPPSLLILIPAVVTTVVTGGIAPLMGPARERWNKAVEKRIGMASACMSQIKGLKMMGLTEFARKLLRQLRVDELKRSVKFRWLLVYLQTLANIAEELTPVIIILSAIYWTKSEQGISVAEAFTSLSIITIASGPLIMILVGMMSVAGALGCFSRLQAFMVLPDREDKREGLSEGSTKSSRISFEGSSQVSDRHHLWSDGSTSAEGDLELEALPRADPSVHTADTSTPMVSFEDATIGVDEADILHNITMTVRHGTLSMIVGRVGCGKTSLLKAVAGEISLKAGRVVLQASSMSYCDQRPWLQNVTIRENILGQSPLNEKWLETVIRACALDEDVALFPLGDKTIVGSGGVALSGGQKQRVALARAVYARKRLLVLDDVLSGLDNRTSKAVFTRLMGTNGLLRDGSITVLFATNNVNLLPAADSITMLEEGRIIRNQVSYSSLEPADWGVLEQELKKVQSAAPDADVPEKDLKEQQVEATAAPEETEAGLSRQTGDIDCYRIYLKSMGWKMVGFILIMVCIHSTLAKLPQIWLKLWTERNDGKKDAGYAGGYVALCIASLIISFSDVAYYVVVCVPRSANNLHEMLLTSVMRAPLYFFTSTDSGITLNRFSQDMTLIDQALPMSFITFIYLGLRALVETGLIASGATYVGAFIPVCFVALYLIQSYYLRTSRQMRFLDLEMKTPLYTQFTETLAGLSTIRAFGWSTAFLLENHRRLNVSQKPYYLMFCIQRWLQVVLDLFLAGMALVLIAFALTATGSSSAGAIGLAMVNLIGFNQTLTLVIDQWTELETSLGAIARLKWFKMRTPNENKEDETGVPALEWPSRGTIELNDITASYSDETDLVIRGLSLKIEAGQKVGICGRSGSGKSSLILAILRLLELRSGSIHIDGQDLSTLTRDEIRAHLNALPQDPFKLSGTARFNLDPEGKVQSDVMLIEVLRKAAIWPALEARGGLEAEMDDVGFSVGQLQLFCLARALLSRSRVVLLDEATSSVDHETDEEIRRVITEEMDGRTVIEVAHRLTAVKDFDVVVVMGEGRIQEIGNPVELLKEQTSEFRALWDSQGL